MASKIIDVLFPTNGIMIPIKIHICEMLEHTGRYGHVLFHI